MVATLDEQGGLGLGSRTIEYADRDAMLYALAVGAGVDELDLIYEGRAHWALPTFATALGLWVTHAAADALGYHRDRNLHVTQVLTQREPLPLSASLEVAGRVTAIHPKSSASIVHISAECKQFTAEYVMWVPGLVETEGGSAGRSARVVLEPFSESSVTVVPVRPDVAALYRLTGDRHPLHIDPGTARDLGHPGPIMHGLCTLGMTVLSVSRTNGVGVDQVLDLRAEFPRPAYPGMDLQVSSCSVEGRKRFTARQSEDVVCEGELAARDRTG